MEAASPIYGKRLLPQIIDDLSAHNPDRVFASYATSSQNLEEFRDVTVQEIAGAVNFAAQWLKERLDDRESKVFAYQGANDIRYPILCLAAIKFGYKILLLGTRNSNAQNESLLSRAQCHTILYSSELREKTEAISISGRTTYEVPSLNATLELGNQAESVPCLKMFAEAQHDSVIIVHSSGSTGDPKLITMTNGTIAVTDNDRSMPVPKGRKPQNAAQFDFKPAGRFYSPFPPYHLAGLQSYLILPTVSETAAVVLGPAQAVPSGFLVRKIMEVQPQLRAIYAPPSLLEQWYKDYNGHEQAGRLDFVLYGGGPLASEVGDALSQVTNVCQMYGSAEIGQVQLLVPKSGAWAYMEWNPFEEVDMQYAGDGLYEMVLHYEAKHVDHRSLHHNLPNVTAWKTGDLFLRNSDDPDLWKFACRTDDLILLSTGHKVHPQQMESFLTNKPFVSGALVFGNGRQQPGLLLELSSKDKRLEKDQVISEIWPAIEEINSQVTHHARIERPQIIICDPERPLFRTPKGSIARKASILKYKEEIDRLEIEHQPLGMDSIPLDTKSSLADCIEVVREIVKRNLQSDQVQDDAHLYAAGLDSLMAVKILGSIRGVVPESVKSHLSLEFLYNNLTIQELGLAICKTLHSRTEQEENARPVLQQSNMAEENPGDRSPDVDGSSTQINGIGTRTEPSIQDIVNMYTSDLPSYEVAKPNKAIDSREAPLTVIMTGWTGLLGSSVLDLLLSNAQVEKIYCFRRRQSRNQNPAPNHGKIVVLDVDMRQAQFGLPNEIYSALIESIDLFLHFGWTVDFNQPLRFYEIEHFRGLRSIIDIAARAPKRPHIFYMSSIAYPLECANQGIALLTIPETIIPTEKVSNGITGYAQSKQIAECILSTASVRSQIPITIIRSGQIVDSTLTKEENRSSWISALILSSKSKGKLPTFDMFIDWMKVEDIAAVILDMLEDAMEQKSCSDLQVYNIVNPNVLDWNSFAKKLASTLHSELIPLDDWVSSLEKDSVERELNINQNPATKLLPFFKRLSQINQFNNAPTIETSKVNKLSKTFRSLKAFHAQQFLEQD